MDPVYHQLMQNWVDRNGYSSLRNPDGYFPDRDGIRPDPVGAWFVKALDAVVDRVSGWRRGSDPEPQDGAVEQKGGALTPVEFR